MKFSDCGATVRKRDGLFLERNAGMVKRLPLESGKIVVSLKKEAVANEVLLILFGATFLQK